MKVIGKQIIDDVNTPMVFECTGIEMEKRYTPGEWTVLMRTAHPSVSFFLLKTERYTIEDSSVKPYKSLTFSEAEAIVKYAAGSDLIDLCKFGDYHIISRETMQTVEIMNTFSDIVDDYEPIMVKIVEDEN